MHEPDITLFPISERKNKVQISDFTHSIAEAAIHGPKVAHLFPDILGGKDLHAFIPAVKAAKDAGKPILFMMGAHVLKVGLGPLLIQLMRAGYITHLATNGAASIHDYEIALIGATSEDVATNLEDGRFGNWQETSQINDIITEGAKRNLGYGEAIGKSIVGNKLPYRNYSVFAMAYELNIPVTVHTALGTEITHQHPNANGAALGQTSMADFKRITATIRNLEDGIVMNWGSSVIMPEVFLKALTVARNQGAEVKHFTAANFDMIRHYRPSVNVVERPTAHGGKGYTLVGQHELMLPLVTLLLLQEDYHGSNRDD